MRGIAIYTGLRVALLAAVWLLIQAVTPLRGLLAIALALVISGAVSFIVLDRSRDKASAGVFGAFRRINDRIEASRTAEDWDDESPSGQGDAKPEQEPVGQHEHARDLEHGHEIASEGTAAHSDDGADSDGRGEQPDPREGQAKTDG